MKLIEIFVGMAVCEQHFPHRGFAKVEYLAKGHLEAIDMDTATAPRRKPPRQHAQPDSDVEISTGSDL